VEVEGSEDEIGNIDDELHQEDKRCLAVFVEILLPDSTQRNHKVLYQHKGRERSAREGGERPNNGERKTHNDDRKVQGEVDEDHVDAGVDKVALEDLSLIAGAVNLEAREEDPENEAGSPKQTESKSHRLGTTCVVEHFHDGVETPEAKEEEDHPKEESKDKLDPYYERERKKSTRIEQDVVVLGGKSTGEVHKRDMK